MHQLSCDHKSRMDLRGLEKQSKKNEKGCKIMAEIKTISLDRYLIVIRGIASIIFY